MSSIVKRVTELADGRELIYFDDADTTLGPERIADARELDPRPETATMRQDVLTGDWVSIASGRQNRVVLPPADRDPLAPQSPTNPSEVPDRYDVVVFENRSPSFGPALADAPDAPRGLDDLAELGLGRRRHLRRRSRRTPLARHPALGSCQRCDRRRVDFGDPAGFVVVDADLERGRSGVASERDVAAELNAHSEFGEHRVLRDGPATTQVRERQGAELRAGE